LLLYYNKSLSKNNTSWWLPWTLDEAAFDSCFFLPRDALLDLLLLVLLWSTTHSSTATPIYYSLVHYYSDARPLLLDLPAHSYALLCRHRYCCSICTERILDLHSLVRTAAPDLLLARALLLDLLVWWISGLKHLLRRPLRIHSVWF
jgi:hypothetical protein